MSSASDAFTYKSAMSSQSTPNIFVRKETLSINDNQNNVYSGNLALQVDLLGYLTQHVPNRR